MSDHKKGQNVFKLYINAIQDVIIKDVLPLVKTHFASYNEYQSLTATLELVKELESDEKILKTITLRSKASPEIDDINIDVFDNSYYDFRNCIKEMINFILQHQFEKAEAKKIDADKAYTMMCEKGYDDRAAKSILLEINGRRKREIETIIKSMRKSLNSVNEMSKKIFDTLYKELMDYITVSAKD